MYAHSYDIEVIQNERNIGTLMVRKIAIEHAKDYLLFIDGDDYLRGDRVIEDCVALIQRSGTDFVWFPMILEQGKTRHIQNNTSPSNDT